MTAQEKLKIISELEIISVNETTTDRPLENRLIMMQAKASGAIEPDTNELRSNAEEIGLAEETEPFTML